MIFFIKFSSRQNVNLSFLVILFTSPFTNRMVHKMLQKNFNVEIIFVVCFISASSSWHHRHHDRGISDFTVTQNRTHLCCSHSTRSSSFASLVQCSRHQLLDLVAIDVSRGRVVSTDKLRVVSSAKSVEKQEAVLTIADERWRRSQNISRVTDSAPLPPTTANNL